MEKFYFINDLSKVGEIPKKTKGNYKFFGKYTYDKDWTELSQEQYEKALTLKKLWGVFCFEAKKEHQK